MEINRRTLDGAAFAAGLVPLALLTLGFASVRNGAAVVMCCLCIAGLVGGRLVGLSGLTLLPVALGIAFLLYVTWIDPPGGPRRTSALVHGAGGMLAGWALAVTLRPRLRWPAWGIAVLAAVLAVAVAWEVGEWLGDRALETALVLDKRDSALDIFFGCFGGAVAVAGVRLVDVIRAPRR